MTDAASPDAHAHAVNVRRAEEWVKADMEGNDSSHDWWHVHRVRCTALRLARDEGLPLPAQQCAELAALLHDVADYKYTADAEAAQRALREFVRGGCGSGGLALGATQQALILHVIASLGFKEGLPSAVCGGAGSNAAGSAAPTGGSGGSGGGGELDAGAAAVLAVVQDADRLDAIGAVGIARCLTFGGQRGRVLHDPAVQPREALTREAYMDKRAEQTTLNHFHEKLFKLKGLMRTAAGRRLAAERHAYMEGFVARLLQEWDGLS